MTNATTRPQFLLPKAMLALALTSTLAASASANFEPLIGEVVTMPVEPQPVLPEYREVEGEFQRMGEYQLYFDANVAPALDAIRFGSHGSRRLDNRSFLDGGSEFTFAFEALPNEGSYEHVARIPVSIHHGRADGYVRMSVACSWRSDDPTRPFGFRRINTMSHHLNQGAFWTHEELTLSFRHDPNCQYYEVRAFVTSAHTIWGYNDAGFKLWTRYLD